MNCLSRQSLLTLAGAAAVLALPFAAAIAYSPKDLAEDPATAVYMKECTACHLAYPPDLLPARNWIAIMTDLYEHFGVDAETGADEITDIQNWLARHASPGKSAFDDGSLILRITDQPWFKRQHETLSAKQVANNPKVKSFAHCDACHQTKIDAAVPLVEFNSDTVSVPQN